jgi:hypothetical protein
MSFFPGKDPAPGDRFACDALELVVVPRGVDLGDFEVRRALPHTSRRTVGPFVFFDHFGPAVFKAGNGLDVRPHPHIGLSTLTYLYDGEITHRDNLGVNAAIRPGEVNWMTAGRGIVHSERTGADRRMSGSRLHGVQLWVALPMAHEEADPDFRHHPAATLPEIDVDGARVRLLVGSAYGAESPVRTLASLFYAEARLPMNAALSLPGNIAERAAFVVDGAVGCGDTRVGASRMIVFAPGAPVALRAESDARLMLLGGAPRDGERHLWWNFVSSSKARIERAKREWTEGRFASVPGETESIPLPDA